MNMKLLLVFLFGSLSLMAQNALDFDGIDDHVTTTNGGPFGTGDRTMECWIKSSNSISSQQVILDYGAMSPLGSRFTLNMINFGLLRIEVGGNGFNSTQSIADGNWHHVAVTYDNSATNKFSLYIDGQLEVSQNTTVPVNTSSGGLIIGQRNDGNGKFQGVIDEVRVWNTVRTQAELDSFKSQEFCTLPAGLLIYFKFNQGIAGGINTGLTTLLNEAGGNNGTLNNFTLSGATSNWVSGVPMNKSGITVKDTLAACDSLISPSGKYVWNTTGVYYDTIPSAIGCDTIMEVDLTITTIDTTIMSNGISVGAAMSGANYQWLDCQNNYAIIPGATAQNYTPPIGGNYAVQIEFMGCVDTSNCLPAGPIDLVEMGNSLWDVYPIPTDQNRTIKIEAQAEGTMYYEVISLSGKLMAKGFLEAEGNTYSLLMNFDSGIYFLRLTGESGSYVYKVPVR